MQPKAFPYVRMSTDEQEKGDSLRRQLDQCKAYAERNGLELSEELNLRDIGVSAYSGENAETGALGRFLNALKAAQIPPGSFLLVESLDRISRQAPMSALGILLDIVKHGVRVVTLSDEHVFDNKMDGMDLIRSMLFLTRAHEESLIKSQRISAAWSNKRKNANTNKLTAMCPSWLTLNKTENKFIVNEKAAETIRYIFKLHNDGLGMNYIVRILNRDKVETFSRAPTWNQSYVSRILRNRSVIGEFQPYKTVSGRKIPAGPPIQNYYPPIIDVDIFNSAENGRRLRTKNGGGRRGEHISNLFSHLLKCGYCARPMRMINKGQPPKGGRYIMCSGAQRGLDCVNTTWRYDKFEELFLTYVQTANLQILLPEHSQWRTAIEGKQGQLSLFEVKLESAKEAVRKAMVFSDVNEQAELIARELIYEKTAEMEHIKKIISQIKSDISDDIATLEQFSRSINTIKSIVSAIQNANADNNLALRAATAQHISSIIERVVVFTSGEKYAIVNELKKYSDADLDHEDPETGISIRSLYDELYNSYDYSTPQFIVFFKDGRHQLINSSDGTPEGLYYNELFDSRKIQQNLPSETEEDSSG